MTRSGQTNPSAERIGKETLARERRLFVRALRAAGHPEKHFDLQHYVGSPLPALGVYTRDMQTIGRAFHRRHPQLPAKDLHPLCQALWTGTTFEERILACELLVIYSARWTEGTWHLATSWVDGAEGWGLCDTLGAGVIGRLLEQRPSRFREVRAWTRSSNQWRRRASLYAMNRWVRSGQLDRPFEILLRLHRDPAFWVRRAVGTWLRECWKKDRCRTEQFLLAHARELSAITITVATERAPRDVRNRLRSLATSSA
ncbi:MAG: DNA alkylation repair protein [Thermoplasmata archaeon]|nr:DNA alkylation repair protein [Thermoplasmata archaeon]